MNKHNTILIDCDGVLMNWNQSFEEWMITQKGHIIADNTQYPIHHRYDISPREAMDCVAHFNDTQWIKYLDPLPRAVPIIKSLYHDHGIRFVVISSLGGDHYSADHRRHNLYEHFGPAIKDIHCLPTNVSKMGVLKSFAPGHIWIEDHVNNAVIGAGVGHKTIIHTHPYNLHEAIVAFKDDTTDNMMGCVSNWRDMEDKILDTLGAM